MPEVIIRPGRVEYGCIINHVQMYTPDQHWLRPPLGGYHPLVDIGAANGIEFILKFSYGHGTSIGSF